MNLQGKRVCIVGMGRSGIAAARLVMRHRGIPAITDAAPAEALLPFLRLCRDEHIQFETGGHTSQFFDNADLVVMSPGIPSTIPRVRDARTAGIPVVGEIELAARFCTARILAVTGTNGKTTTTELLRALLERSGHTALSAGNTGYPLSALVMRESQPDYVALELSSYQLETIHTFHPWLAAVLNLSPDHLGRHGTMAQYASTKARIFMNQVSGDGAVLNADDDQVDAMGTPPGVTRHAFSLRAPVKAGLWSDGTAIFDGDAAIARRSDVPLPGAHNLANALAALAMMRLGGFDWTSTLAGLRDFSGVEHRIERVRSLNGVTYYNDSKSTNIDSLRVALEAFDCPVVLIAGGRGKGAPYEGLRELVRQRVSRLICIGEDAPALQEALGEVTDARSADSMHAAVQLAAMLAAPGEAVLLSPACASFDMYANFEERGTDFKRLVMALPGDNAEKTEIELCARK